MGHSTTNKTTAYCELFWGHLSSKFGGFARKQLSFSSTHTHTQRWRYTHFWSHSLIVPCLCTEYRNIYLVVKLLKLYYLSESVFLCVFGLFAVLHVELSLFCAVCCLFLLFVLCFSLFVFCIIVVKFLLYVFLIYLFIFI